MISWVGCSGTPNVENETNKYNSSQKNLKKLAPKYPNFRSFLVTVSQDAHKFALEAQKLKDEREKAKKFQLANKVFTDSRFFRQLSSMDVRMESVRTKKNELAVAVSRKHQKSITTAVKQATQALNEANSILTAAKPATTEAAVKEIKKANSILISAEAKLNSARKLSRVKSEKKKSLFKGKKKK